MTAQRRACAALTPDRPRLRSAIWEMSLVDRSSVQAEIFRECFGLRGAPSVSLDWYRTARQKCHQSATRTKMVNEWLVWLAVNLLILLGILVALPGLEPGLFALRGRRVNQLHHNAMNGLGIRCDLLSIAKFGAAKKQIPSLHYTLRTRMTAKSG